MLCCCFSFEEEILEIEKILGKQNEVKEANLFMLEVEF